MTKIDPYAIMAEEQITAPVKARLRAAKTRAERRAAKAQDDKQIQHGLWKAWHDKRVERLRLGHYRRKIERVAGFLERMTFEDGADLVALIEDGAWHHADAETRYLLLGLIDNRIVYLREAEGMAPFDDSLPFSDEAPTAFEIIREKLQP